MKCERFSLLSSSLLIAVAARTTAPPESKVARDIAVASAWTEFAGVRAPSAKSPIFGPLNERPVTVSADVPRFSIVKVCVTTPPRYCQSRCHPSHSAWCRRPR